MKTLGKIALTIGLLIVVIFAMSIARVIVKSTFNNHKQGKADKAVEELLKDFAKEINSQAPIMVDPATRFDMAMCYGKTMHFKYTMINSSEYNELDKEVFKNVAMPTLVKNQCNNKKVVEMLKMGVEYDYIYFDKNGIHITTIHISEKNCGF